MNNVSFTVEILPLWLYGHVPLVSRFPQKVKQLQCCWLEQTRFFFVLFLILKQRLRNTNIKCINCQLSDG